MPCSCRCKTSSRGVQLSPIDTYFMIDCVNGGKVPAPVDPKKINT